MLAPEQNWWKPLGRLEKTWLTVALVWCIFLTVMMPLWYYMGKQNVPAETYRTTPQQYASQWYPILQLEKGKEYRLHISSMDYAHGFSLQPVNINLEVLPGYDYVATITPTSSGEFTIVCNEYCFLGHHTMVGKIIVK